jgi:hypothetical protein
MYLKIEPKTIAVRASRTIVYNCVIWVGDPETSWSLIAIQNTPRPVRFNDKVSVDNILGFNSIFKEN